MLISIGFVLTKTSQKYDLSLKQSAKYYASKIFPEKFKTDGIPYHEKIDTAYCLINGEWKKLPRDKVIEYSYSNCKFLDPDKKDTDGDGISDYDEMFKYKTIPVIADTDGDTLTDYEEIFKYHTNPLSPDTDKDGFPDDIELKVYENYGDPNDPNLPKDNDSDGYTDYFEKYVLHTNPFEPNERYGIFVWTLGGEEPEIDGYKSFLVNVGKWKSENIYTIKCDDYRNYLGEDKPFGGVPEMQEAMRNDFKKYVEEIAGKVKDGDLVLIGLNGHGNPRGMNFMYYDELVKDLEEIKKGKIVVMVDACHSGGAIDYFKNSEIKDRTVVITSTDAEHSSATAIIVGTFDRMVDPEYAHPDSTIHKNYVSLKEAFEFKINSRESEWWEYNGYPQLSDPNKLAENTYLIEYPFSNTSFYKEKAVELRRKYLGWG